MFFFFSFVKLLANAFWAFISYSIRRLFSPPGKKLDLAGNILTGTIIRLGPLYIKIGQILSTRADLLPPDIIRHLSTLQDDIPAMRRPDLVKVLERAYRMPYQKIMETVFLEFDETPVASASIAQVHRAGLATGESVAVKVVKIGVRKSLGMNMRILHFLTRVVYVFSPYARRNDLPKRFLDISRLLMNQADMIRERINQKAVAVNFSEHPYLKIPKVYDSCSNEDVLVMDFVNGIRGNEPHKVSMDRARLAKRAQDIIYTMLFLHGFSHGDPHPGNFFYSETGDFYLVDFGIVVELSEDEKWGLSSFIYACIRREWSLAVKRLTEYFVLEKYHIQADYPQYEAMMMKVLMSHFDVIAKHWSIIRFLGDASKVLSVFHSSYTYNFQKVILVLLSCEGVVALIDPAVNIWDNARKFADRFSPYMSDEVKKRFDEYFGQTIPKTLALRKEVSDYYIAPTHFDRYILPSAYPLIVKTAEGSVLTDIDDNRYIDLSCGYGPHILGYNHPVLQKAIEEASSKGSINALGHLPEIELARMIVDALPSAEKVIFSNSGTEAVVQALRICRGYRRRNKVAKFEGHYHGFSDQGMTSSWFRFSGPKERPEPIAGCLGAHTGTVADTVILQYGHDISLERIEQEADGLACVILEPMPASSAYYDIPFLENLRALLTRLDIPLVFDEVVSGFRVDYKSVQGITGVTPDITCLGKIIGGGLPCGAVAGKAQFLNTAKSTLDPFKDYEDRVFVGGTMSGNSITCSAGAAMLRYLKVHRDIYTRLHESTVWLTNELTAAAKAEHIPFRMKAAHSIFSMTFSYNSSRYFREKSSGSNLKANIALSYYMRKHGVYLPELHTMFLSAAHSDTDLKAVRDAFHKSIIEMASDGFFIY